MNILRMNIVIQVMLQSNYSGVTIGPYSRKKDKGQSMNLQHMLTEKVQRSSSGVSGGHTQTKSSNI